jgi:plastocyanin
MSQSSYQSDNGNPNGIPVVEPPSRRRGPGKWLVAAVILVVIGVASILVIRDQNKQSTQAESVASVQITESGFVPETIKIKQGQSVTWTNTDSKLHQVAADPYPTHSKLPSFLSEESLSQNESYSFNFDKAGTYTYHDPLNPTTFKATVIVE